jgi:hypothetical protein
MSCAHSERPGVVQATVSRLLLASMGLTAQTHNLELAHHPPVQSGCTNRQHGDRAASVLDAFGELQIN